MSLPDFKLFSLDFGPLLHFDVEAYSAVLAYVLVSAVFEAYSAVLAYVLVSAELEAYSAVLACVLVRYVGEHFHPRPDAPNSAWPCIWGFSEESG